MNKKAEIVLIISGIISILVSIFLVIYYKLIIKNHMDPMHDSYADEIRIYWYM